MLVPTTQSTGTCISSKARNTPTCARPRAPPPDNTTHTRGREAVSAVGTCARASRAAMHANTSNAIATSLPILEAAVLIVVVMARPAKLLERGLRLCSGGVRRILLQHARQ